MVDASSVFLNVLFDISNSPYFCGRDQRDPGLFLAFHPERFPGSGTDTGRLRSGHVAPQPQFETKLIHSAPLASLAGRIAPRQASPAQSNRPAANRTQRTKKTTPDCGAIPTVAPLRPH